MRAIVNGKLVDLPNGATVEELRSQLPEIGNDDVMEEGANGTHPLKDNEALKEGSKVWSVPKIVKGNFLNAELLNSEILQTARLFHFLYSLQNN
jgi:hypothetical protein